MFLDEATIEVFGGIGGRGCVSWRREKYIPKGGPNGGNGGRGGSIYLIANENTDTLSNFASKKKFDAPKGRFGMGQNKNGKDGEDLWLKVPPGTQITEVGGNVIADLQHKGDQILVARGGRGGYGNAHFKSSTRQCPDFAELGEPGEERTITLELKLVADVGIIGYPSVGKSTLISVISAAKPKIADYPFTTIIPNLGVVHVGDRPAGHSLGEGRSYIVCDVPGLIEGASEGKGLGDQFLRHIERCGILLHLLDISRALGEGGKVDTDILVQDYKNIRKELEAYSPTLAKKKELVLLNKTDLKPDDVASIEKKLKKKGISIFMSISAATTSGTSDLIKALLPIVLEERESTVVEEEEDIPVLRPHLASKRMGAYRIEQKDDQIIIYGKRLEQLTKMTDFSAEGGVHRFRDVLDRIGLTKALARIEKKEGTPIYIGEIQVDSYL